MFIRVPHPPGPGENLHDRLRNLAAGLPNKTLLLIVLVPFFLSVLMGAICFEMHDTFISDPMKDPVLATIRPLIFFNTQPYDLIEFLMVPEEGFDPDSSNDLSQVDYMSHMLFAWHPAVLDVARIEDTYAEALEYREARRTRAARQQANIAAGMQAGGLDDDDGDGWFDDQGDEDHDDAAELEHQWFPEDALPLVERPLRRLTVLVPQPAEYAPIADTILLAAVGAATYDRGVMEDGVTGDRYPLAKYAPVTRRDMAPPSALFPPIRGPGAKATSPGHPNTAAPSGRSAFDPLGNSPKVLACHELDAHLHLSHPLPSPPRSPASPPPRVLQFQVAPGADPAEWAQHLWQHLEEEASKQQQQQQQQQTAPDAAPWPLKIAFRAVMRALVSGFFAGAVAASAGFFFNDTTTILFVVTVGFATESLAFLLLRHQLAARLYPALAFLAWLPPMYYSLAHPMGFLLFPMGMTAFLLTSLIVALFVYIEVPFAPRQQPPLLVPIPQVSFSYHR
ncbi:hypothetical protein PAPYR_1683 [Paratrimastix pyriformis]|uniref:Transmembrane protein n=1 Tax=Paratrimastix pyriformis TaxID=342808 RepID=A0ABQ8US67_9EUKA|nr:hypothetical protein PAPYR_1683 [Paratrimastix pyriformis]